MSDDDCAVISDGEDERTRDDDNSEVVMIDDSSPVKPSASASPKAAAVDKSGSDVMTIDDGKGINDVVTIDDGKANKDVVTIDEEQETKTPSKTGSADDVIMLEDDTITSASSKITITSSKTSVATVEEDDDDVVLVTTPTKEESRPEKECSKESHDVKDKNIKDEKSSESELNVEDQNPPLPQELQEDSSNSSQEVHHVLDDLLTSVEKGKTSVSELSPSPHRDTTPSNPSSKSDDKQLHSDNGDDKQSPSDNGDGGAAEPGELRMDDPQLEQAVLERRACAGVKDEKPGSPKVNQEIAGAVKMPDAKPKQEDAKQASDKGKK